MKKIFLLILPIILLTFSCKDKCKKENNCSDNGTCIAGECACDDGYTGDDCSKRISDELTGTYEVVSNCGGTSNIYTVTIVADDNNPTIVIFKNLVNKICDGNEVAIPLKIFKSGTQTFLSNIGNGSSYNFSCNGVANQFSISSQAEFAAGYINMSYSLSDGFNSTFCSITMHKN